MIILTGTLLVIHQSSASSLPKIVPVAWTFRISLDTSKRRRAAGGGEIKNDIKGRIPVGVMDSTITVGSTEVPVEVLIKRDIIEDRIIKFVDVVVKKNILGSQGDTAAAKNNLVFRLYAYSLVCQIFCIDDISVVWRRNCELVSVR